MNTGNRFSVAVLSAGLAAAFFMMGCGGGGGGGSAAAPGSLRTRSYTFNETGDGSSTVTFTTDSNYAFRHTTGQVESGTYNSSRSGNTWTVMLLSNAGGQQAFAMTFASGTGGTYTLQRSGEAERSGSFFATSEAVSSGDVGPPPASSTTGGETGSSTTGATSTGSSTTGSTTTGSSTTGSATTGSTTTGTTTSGSTTTGGSGAGYSGFSPLALNGRTMLGTRTFTSTGPTGQRHTYTFTATTFHDSDPPEEAGGTYTYSASNSRATLELRYNTPSTFVGDRHVLTMTFTAKDQGNFESTYTRGDGTTITINGNFEIR